MDNEQNQKAIDYRLSNIEKTLAELKDVIVENKLQAREITELKAKTTEFVSAINAHDQRIRALELRPDKEKATKWSIAIESVLKIILTAAVTLVLAKIGLE